MATTGLFDSWVAYFPEFLPGLWVTVSLTAMSLVIGMPLGVVLAVAAGATRRAIRWPTVALIELGRGTPGLIVLYLVYFGLPQVGLTLTNFIAASLALAVTTGGYTSEIFRAGIRAVPQGHREASRALGLNPAKELRLVVLPQALRTVIPPLVGFAIILYQATSLAYAISTPELLSRAYNTPSTASRALVDAAFPATTVGVIGVLAEEPTEDQIEQA